MAELVDAAPFLVKTYEMVDDPSTDAVVSWGEGSNSFVVWSAPEFARDLLPKWFKHSNFSSFVRQLNTYGFRKVDPDRWEFANEGFLRGRKHLLKTITRRKSSQTTQGHNQHIRRHTQYTSVAACVEVGKFGLEEEIERLKRDKNVLMQEIVRLRQQHQTSDNQLQTLVKFIQGMEQRQQQMMSFLVKAMQSPEFLSQLAQQSESDRRIATANRKRRLQDSCSGSEWASPDGQMIKFQPLINEAAKAMLKKILNFDASQRFGSTSNPDNLVLQNYVPATDIYDNSSTTRSSGVTLSKVLSTSNMRYMTGGSGFSSICSSTPTPSSEFQCPSSMPNKLPKDHPNVNVISSIPNPVAPECSSTGVPELANLQEMVVNISNDSSAEVCAFPVQESLVDTMEIPGDETELVLSESQMLPPIIDPFWEQFFTASPLPADNEEIDSSLVGSTDLSQRLDNGLNDLQSMGDLTEQAGFLMADPDT